MAARSCLMRRHLGRALHCSLSDSLGLLRHSRCELYLYGYFYRLCTLYTNPSASIFARFSFSFLLIPDGYKLKMPCELKLDEMVGQEEPTSQPKSNQRVLCSTFWWSTNSYVSTRQKLSHHFSKKEIICTPPTPFALFEIFRIRNTISNPGVIITSTLKMSWRNQGITGSNNIPLGKRRFGGGDEDATPPADDIDMGHKRGRSPEPSKSRPSFARRGQRESPIAFSPLQSHVSLYLARGGPHSNRSLNLGSEADGPKRRKKRNRWGDASENKAAGLMGLPTAIMANMTSEQLEAYTLHLRIEEISQKLRIDDVVPADGDRYAHSIETCQEWALTFYSHYRSPSPAPQYDNQGRRINTREYRYRKRLEDERHKLIEKAMKTIPNYHPPQDYRRPTKTQEKVYVPVNDYPEINFSMIANPLTLVTNLPHPTLSSPSLSFCFPYLVSSRPVWNTARYLAMPPPLFSLCGVARAL